MRAMHCEPERLNLPAIPLAALLAECWALQAMTCFYSNLK